MKLAILGGTGKEGKGLARRWARAGHEIEIGSRDPEKGRRVARELQEELGKTAISGTGNREAAAAASVIVSTLPHQSQVEILSGLAKHLEGKLLLTASIAWPPELTGKLSAAEELQGALAGIARIVAAFQTVSAGALAAAESTEPEDVLIFSDDVEAADRASSLVGETGLRGVVCGPLRFARVAEAMTGLLLKVNKRYGVKTAGVRITGLPEDA